MKNPVKKFMDKLCKPATIPNKKAIKTREIDIENARLELDSYTDSFYDEDSLNIHENEGEN